MLEMSLCVRKCEPVLNFADHCSQPVQSHSQDFDTKIYFHKRCKTGNFLIHKIWQNCFSQFFNLYAFQTILTIFQLVLYICDWMHRWPPSTSTHVHTCILKIGYIKKGFFKIRVLNDGIVHYLIFCHHRSSSLWLQRKSKL